MRHTRLWLGISTLILVFIVAGIFEYGCGGSKSGSGAPVISSQPANQAVVAGQMATFSVTANGQSPLAYQWSKNGATVSGATSSSYTMPATTAGDNGSTFSVTVSNSLGSVTSNSATLTVTSGSGGGSGTATASVLTYHNDVARTGQNLNETTLTTSNVNSSSFGKVGFLTTTGKVDAEPLYVPNLTIAGAAHNVVFVATEHDLVYAFDANSFTQLWQTSVLGSGETTSDNHDCNQISPEIGVTSTPVIDPSAGAHGTIFVVAMSKDSSGNYHQRLHALDLTTGAEQSGSPVEIQASYPSTSGQDTFESGRYAERSGLLLLNGVIYMGWTSHCDQSPYQGWLMGYNESTLQQTTVLNVIPNGSEGSIWMSGAGLAADASGFIYFLDANGTFDTTLNSNNLPAQGDYGNSFMKISTSGGTLSVADYFAMSNTVNESDADEDLGSGGALVLPDQTGSSGTVHLAVGAGKDGSIYVVNRDNMGKFNPNGNSGIYQEIDGEIGGQEFGMPAYFNGTVYYGAVSSALKAFPITSAKLATSPSSMSSATFAYPGTTPSISANGTSNGIVWAVEDSNGDSGPGVLHAYDATNLATELYNSNQAANGRDSFTDNKFITPMIANGKVYVGTPTGVIVFGLLQ
ncbi:MAG TPA: immunoglobulin domain-containing protein [Candidatus Acidoferrum sp.]|nr:immunoglobulin domain-containing protein [Candidatus Acidoferrum sp.]